MLCNFTDADLPLLYITHTYTLLTALCISITSRDLNINMVLFQGEKKRQVDIFNKTVHRYQRAIFKHP